MGHKAMSLRVGFSFYGCRAAEIRYVKIFHFIQRTIDLSTLIYSCTNRGSKRKRSNSFFNKSISTFLLVLIASFFTIVSTQVFAQEDGEPEFAPGSVLVKFRPGTPGNAKNDARNSVTGQFEEDYKIVPGLERIFTNFSVEKAISILEKNPNVEYAEPNFAVSINTHIDPDTPDDTNFNLLWGMSNINAEQAWDASTGDPGIVIGVIDTGVDYTHEDLAANMWENPGEIPNNNIDDDGNGIVDDYYGASFCNMGQTSGDPMPGHYHGTHVAGTICAVGNNGVGVVGVNWGCSIMALRFLCGSNGSGWTSDAILAVQYANSHNVKFTNNSWGGGGFSQGLLDAIEAADSVFVAAAGNNGSNNDTNPHYPSSLNADNLIAVASITSSNAKSSFSNMVQIVLI